MRVKVDDYLLLKGGGKKPVLVKCTKDEKPYKAISEAQLVKAEDLTPIQFTLKDVMANLGSDPAVGRIYGLLVEPLRKRVQTSTWGEIRIYKPLEPKKVDQLKSLLKKAKVRFQQLGVLGLKLDLEIRNPSGKYAGYYKHFPKTDTDILALKPDDNFSDFMYYISHEWGHGLWSRRMIQSQRAKWITAYHDCIKLTKVKVDRLQAIREEIENAGNLSDYMRDADEDDLPVLKACLRHIAHAHSLDKECLNTLVIAGKGLKPYWPSSVDIADKQLILTEYAKKSPYEFFSEAFALYCVGKQLPKDVTRLVQRTLASLTPPAK